MDTQVTEIAKDIFRISTFNPDFGMQFNQFLIKDDEPFLMHTGFKGMFPMTLEGVSRILNPASLRWIGFSHFESDECGALNEWLRIAPNALPVCGLVGAMVNINDFALREACVLAHDEILPLGKHRLKYLATPHVPHAWDAGLFFEESERTLLCSDLFFQPGNPEPVTEGDIVGPARHAIVESLKGPFAQDMPYTAYTNGTLRNLAELKPATLAVMHGSSYHGEGSKAILELAEVIDEVLGQ